jgi:hypothetical protein
MTRLLKQPMYWVWFFVFMWAGHGIYTVYAQHWTGLIIALTGLISALMVAAAIQSRRRKTMYPGHGHHNSG